MASAASVVETRDQLPRAQSTLHVREWFATRFRAEIARKKRTWPVEKLRRRRYAKNDIFKRAFGGTVDRGWVLTYFAGLTVNGKRGKYRRLESPRSETTVDEELTAQTMASENCFAVFCLFGFWKWKVEVTSRKTAHSRLRTVIWERVNGGVLAPHSNITGIALSVATEATWLVKYFFNYRIKVCTFLWRYHCPLTTIPSNQMVKGGNALSTRNCNYTNHKRQVLYDESQMAPVVLVGNNRFSGSAFFIPIVLCSSNNYSADCKMTCRLWLN